MAKSLNPHLKKKPRKYKDPQSYIDGFSAGNRYMLSEVLTLAESTQPTQRTIADQILAKLKRNNTSIRIGITGSPGAGKSTLIESLGKHLIDIGKKVAVLAIDPSSTKSKGSILGDKTRMPILSNEENAYIRPTATANVLGGAARTTKESIALCEAAGYDVIFVESVGVGQSETMISDLVDIFVLVLLPGGGDEVQGIKRGIVEMADILVINKNDGDRKKLASQTKNDFAAANRLFHHEMDNWKVPTILCSALHNEGIPQLWESIVSYHVTSKEQDAYVKKRIAQDEKWLQQQILHIIFEKSKALFSYDENASFSKDDGSDKTISIFETLQASRDKIIAEYNRLKEK